MCIRDRNKAKFPSVQVTAAVIKGKIRVWNYVEGKWTGAEAAHMYTNVLAKALKRAFPNQRAPFSVIEDNDPTGYKSRAGVDAKRKAGIVADSLPKRRPDLNVLDYALWNAINRRMCAQEAKYRKAKKEATSSVSSSTRSSPRILHGLKQAN